jgi:hypothetical protein
MKHDVRDVIFNGKIGIGTNVPAQKLHVEDGNAYFDGNVGIGTDNPSQLLHVEGQSYLNGTVDTNNNNINAGTGTVTASTFSGTATQVSNSLSTGDSYLVGSSFDGSSSTSWTINADSVNGNGTIVARDGSGNFSAGTISANLSGTATQVSNSLSTGDSYLVGSSFDGSSSTSWTINADSANGNGTIVARDGSGNFSANNIIANGTLTASNLVVLGDTVQLDTITSNTEQMVITNDGTGPALQVTQTGSQPIADFYDDGNVLALRIADGGLVGIGTTNPSQLLHVEGQSYLNGTVNTNNNNINAGTGTVTASTFNGTATNVSSYLNVGSYLTGDNFDGSSATTWAVDATSTNTDSKVVARDESGDFSAGTITANLTGNVSGTATQVSNSLSTGDSYLVGSSFDGSSAVSWTINADSTNGNGTIVARDGSGNFSAGTISANLSGTATNVSSYLNVGSYLTGDNFDGSAASTIAVDGTTTSSADKVVVRDGNANMFASGIGISTASLSSYKLYVVGDINYTGNLYQNGSLFTGGGSAVWSNSGNTIYYTTGNVGIGTNNPLQLIHIEGDSYLNGTVSTNNNNINAGTGTVTASTFSGTATQVSNSLSTGDSYLVGSSFDGSSAVSWTINADSANGNGTIVARDGSGNFSAGTITANLSGTATQVSNSLSTGDSYLVGSSFDGSSATSWTINADSANGNDTIVARDGSGNFSAGTITANLSGTATQVSNSLSTGDSYLVGSSFDGSSAVSWTINADSANGNDTIVARDGSGNFSANNIIANGTLTASNLVVLGDTVQLDTITSNTEQMVITNDGTGPALKVTQTGTQPIADFYDDSNVLALRIADGGTVGIGTDSPTEQLHVNGNARVDGTINTYYGSASEPAHSFTNDSDTGMFIAVADELGFSTGGTERVRIDSNGNVGIGTTNPLTSLTITPSSTGSKITLYDGGILNNHFGFGVSSLQLNYHVSSTSTSHVFYVGGRNGNGTELMRIKGDGNVGIGTDDPAQKLHVNGNARVDGNVGIGTNNPAQKLHVHDGGIVFSSLYNSTISTTTPVNNVIKNSSTLTTGNWYRIAVNGSIPLTPSGGGCCMELDVPQGLQLWILLVVSIVLAHFMQEVHLV